MTRSFFSTNGGFRRRRVGALAAAALAAGLSVGPGMWTAESKTPAGTIERVSVPDGQAGADRNARPDSGSSLACSALNARRCTKRTMSDDGSKVVYSSAAGNLVDGDTNNRVDVFLTTLNPGKPPTPPSAGSGGSPADPGVAPSVASTVRISVGSAGEGNGDSLGASISPDGKWIAFESSASNLVGSDANGPQVDVFVYNVDTKAIHLASVPAGGGGADGPSYSASVANNGTVAFTSKAGNLVGGASGEQVFARVDPAGAGSTILVSAATSGGGDGRSGEATISGDGTKVAFMSEAANIGSGGSPGADIFIATLGTTSSVMMLTSAADAYLPSISADGMKVVFIANGYDNDGLGDIYQSSAQGGAKPTIFANCPCRSGGDVAPVWATVGTGGAILYSSSAPFSRSNRYLDAQIFEHNPGQAIVSVRDEMVANGPAEWPSVSADGALVAFESTADNLVDGDTNAASDVFVAQMGDGGSGVEAWKMIKVSVYATGDARKAADSAAPSPGSPASVSADGNLVAFASDSSNLVPGDTNGASDIFVRNRHTGKTERVSLAAGGTQADGPSVAPQMSAEGRYVVFASEATNLVPGDTNGVMDIYVYDRAERRTKRVSLKGGSGESPLPAMHPTISPNGAFVAFDSAGEFADMAQSGSGRPNVFRYRMDSGAIDMVSTMQPDQNSPERKAGYKASWGPSVADDGSVAFLSEQTAMTASNADDPVGSIPNWVDVYVARPDGTIIKASMNSDPQPVPAVGDSYDPQISADGSKVVFVVGGKSNMPKTGADANPGPDVYLRDLSTNTTTQINVGGDGAAAGGGSRRPAVNKNGSVVAFVSDSANLAGGDTNGLDDVFVAKVAGGVTVTRVGPSGGQADGYSAMPALSLEGATVAFASRASNMVSGDGNGVYDWFALSISDVPCVTCDGDGIGDGPIGTPPGPVPGTASGPGYRFVAADGGIFAFDQPFAGSAGATKLAKPIVGMAATPSNNGYWLVASDGGIFSYGDAAFWGSTGNIKLAKPIVGMTATPTGKGYWFVASDGGIFAFGDAAFHGSMGGKPLAQPIVGMASTASGKGYWLVAADGGIFSFGDAAFHGSTGNIKLAKPIVGMDRTASGKGYRFVASDGGIFSFGDATFHGSMGGKPLAKPIVGMARTRTGDGYWLVASDGGIFSFGAAGFHGSTGNLKLASPIVGMAS